MNPRGASPDRPRATRAPVLPRLLRSRRGGSTIEYALILAFVVLMMFGALATMAKTTTDLWNDMSSRVTSAR